MSPHKRRIVALPTAMVLGVIFHGFFDSISFLTPYLICAMLFVTFCRVSAKEIKFTKLHWILLGIQLIGSSLIFLVFKNINEVLAQGLMICIMAPCAMAATTIAGMLGANVTTMASFCLLSNLGVAFAVPVIFAVIGTGTGMPFFASAGMILAKVVPLLVFPFVFALLFDKISPKLHAYIKKRQSISFWLWAVSLTIVLGNTVEFLIKQPSSNYTTEIILAVSSLVLCLAQFIIGRRLGKRFGGDRVAGGQSLGQKNTVLAIWMAQTWLNPLSSVAPAAYVVWQNIVNSYQLWRFKDERHEDIEGD